MRIAVWHNLPSGGGKRALFSQIKGLIAHGHHVEVWCPETADTSYLDIRQLTVEHRLSFPLIQPDTIRRRLDLVRRRPDELLQTMDRHSAEVARAIGKGSFDLVFANSCLFYRVPRLAHFLPPTKPVVLYLQEPCRWRYEALPELPWLAPSRFSSAEKPVARLRAAIVDYVHLRALRFAARREVEDAALYPVILVNSFYSHESVARAYGLDSRVCYLGYDDALFRWSRKPRGDFVIGVGSMDYIKGVDTCIEALANIPSASRPNLIWVANSGDNSYGQKMESLAKRLCVNFRVEHRISDDRLADLLNRAKLLIYTSRLEPFGYAPIEANACGAPVVAIAEGGVRETVQHGSNGLLCSRDPIEIASMLVALLQNAPEARRLGETGAKLSPQKWSQGAAVDRLETELLRAVNGWASRQPEKEPS